MSISLTSRHRSVSKTAFVRPEGYKWIALSNTTMGVLMASIDANIVLISLPAIFRGIEINPLAPGEVTYLLWVLMGYMVVTATLLISFGRLSDIFGRVRLYNLGFAIFTIGSILLFLAVVDWRLIFLVSVPVGIAGTVWAYLRLQETGTINRKQRLDPLGNTTFGLGLTALLVALTYWIMPYGSSVMGWSSPLVRGGIAGGLVLLVAFVFIEQRVPHPMFRLSLFRIRMFAAGNVSGFLYSVACGGLMFMLIIWLQGVWLPLHGYNFADTLLWAGIYMSPLMGGFFLMGPASGWLSDRFGSRGFATAGMLLTVTGFLLLASLPANFSYLPFLLILVLLGFGMGMFAAPNTTAILNSVPPQFRGVASGMRATIQNSGSLLSMAHFFSLVVVGLSTKLPPVLYHGLAAAGIPAAEAAP